jgi:DNA-binding SARP family transcriptional activator/tetratricopeptide (TPR) repeat protein
MIELRTLGTAALVVNGEHRRLPTQKHLALLVYISFHQGLTVRRDRLASLLWEDAGRRQGLHSVSQALYAIRTILPELRLLYDRSEVLLPEGAIRVDALEFIQAASSNQLAHAEQLYNGRFLGDFWIQGAALFEEWKEAQHQHIEGLARHIHWDLLSTSERAGDWIGVERIATKMLAMDPFDEKVHRARILAIAAGGSVHRAITELRNLEQIIGNELGRPVDAETSAIADRLHRMMDHGPHSMVRNEPTNIVVEPFVGRREEFAQLQSEWNIAKAGNQRFVVILGEAGIGKTRFCERFVRLAVLHDARVLRSTCYPAATQIPYGAIVDAILSGVTKRDILSLHPSWQEVISELIPELCGDNRSVASHISHGEGARRRLFEGVAQLITEICRQQPVVIFIDDFQWADDSTAALINYIVRRVAGMPLLVLAAARSEELAGDSLLGRMLRARDADTSIVNIVLRGLAPEHARSLIDQVLRAYDLTLQPGVCEVIQSQTAGVPFFIVETLRAIRDGEIVPDGAGAPASHSAVLMPSSVEDFLKGRIHELSDDAIEIIYALAVLGNAVDVDAIHEVTGLSSDVIWRGVAELGRKGFVKDEQSAIGLTHDLLREAAYRDIDPIRRRIIHGRAARLLEHRDSAAVGKIAIHYDLAGNRLAAFKFSIRAAEASEKVHAPAEAEFFLRMALSNALDEMQRVEAQERLAGFLYRWSRFGEADLYYSKLEDYYTRAQCESGLLAVKFNRMCRALKERAVPVRSMIDDLNELALVAERLRDHDTLVDILVKLAEVGHDDGRTGLMLAVADRLLRTAEANRDNRQAIRALCVAANIVCIYKSIYEGMKYAERAVTYASVSGNAHKMLTAYRARAKAHFLMGALDRTQQDLSVAINYGEKMALVEAIQDLRTLQAIALMESGEYQASEEIMLGVIASAEDSDSNQEKMIACGNLMVLYYEMRDLYRARRAASEMLSWDVHAVPWWCNMTAWSILGLCALERGRFAEANQCRREVLLRFEGRDFWVSDVSYAEMFLARLAAMEGEVENALARLERAITAYEGRDVFCLSRLQLERARLLVDRDPGEAWRLAGAVRTRAKEMGARPLVAKADAILDRVPTPGV